MKVEFDESTWSLLLEHQWDSSKDYWENVSEIAAATTDKTTYPISRGQSREFSARDTLRVVMYETSAPEFLTPSKDDPKLAPHVKIANRLRESLVGRIGMSWTPSVYIHHVRTLTGNDHYQVCLDIRTHDLPTRRSL